jgi:hypothetical protein
MQNKFEVLKRTREIEREREIYDSTDTSHDCIPFTVTNNKTKNEILTQ